MSFTDIHGFRPISRMLHPSLFVSYFLGGPSSKTISYVPDGENAQQVLPPHFHQPLPGFTTLTHSDPQKMERAVAIVMLAIIPGSFVLNSVFINYLLAVSLAIHAHWGMDTVLISYCPRKALPFANVIRYILTTIAFAGLCYFNRNDMGLIKALKALWAMH